MTDPRTTPGFDAAFARGMTQRRMTRRGVTQGARDRIDDPVQERRRPGALDSEREAIEPRHRNTGGNDRHHGIHQLELELEFQLNIQFQCNFQHQLE